MKSRARRLCRDRRKQSIYLPADMLDRLHTESGRLDRSLSWIVQRCVRLAIEQVEALPAIDAVEAAE